MPQNRYIRTVSILMIALSFSFCSESESPEAEKVKAGIINDAGKAFTAKRHTLLIADNRNPPAPAPARRPGTEEGPDPERPEASGRADTDENPYYNNEDLKNIFGKFQETAPEGIEVDGDEMKQIVESENYNESDKEKVIAAYLTLIESNQPDWKTTLPIHDRLKSVFNLYGSEKIKPILDEAISKRAVTGEQTLDAYIAEKHTDLSENEKVLAKLTIYSASVYAKSQGATFSPMFDAYTATNAGDSKKYRTVVLGYAALPQNNQPYQNLTVGPYKSPLAGAWETWKAWIVSSIGPELKPAQSDSKYAVYGNSTSPDNATKQQAGINRASHLINALKTIDPSGASILDSQFAAKSNGGAYPLPDGHPRKEDGGNKRAEMIVIETEVPTS